MDVNQGSQKRSGLVIAGLVLGIIGVLLSALPIINNFAALLGLLAVIFGVVGIVQSRKGRQGGGMAITSLILGVVTIAVVLISQQMYGQALDEAGKAVNESVDNATGKNTDRLLESDVSVDIGAFSAETGEFGIVTTKLPVNVKNKANEKKSYTVKVEAVDASGTRIADDTVYVNDLGAGQSQAAEAFKYVETDKVEALKTATFKVATVSQL